MRRREAEAANNIKATGQYWSPYQMWKYVIDASFKWHGRCSTGSTSFQLLVSHHLALFWEQCDRTPALELNPAHGQWVQNQPDFLMRMVWARSDMAVTLLSLMAAVPANSGELLLNAASTQCLYSKSNFLCGVYFWANNWQKKCIYKSQWQLIQTMECNTMPCQTLSLEFKEQCDLILY